MKRPHTILATLILFALTLYFAFQQGDLGGTIGGHLAEITEAPISLALYSGVKAVIVGAFASLIISLTNLFGGNLLFGVMALAVLIELILLYPSVMLQLKQKKIHLFHKKLVDRFRSGELPLSKTKHELGILYVVNEELHARGALLVLTQLIVFLTVLWSLNLFAIGYVFSDIPRSALNNGLLTTPVDFMLPLFVGLVMLFHSLVKIYMKQKQDHISASQSRVALLIGMVAATVAYFFSTVSPVLLSVYFAALITFSTARYLIVEQYGAQWSKLAQKDLLEMIRRTEKSPSLFEELSAKWNHFAFVRHTNVHLLEEAASMSLAFMLVINLF